jgi:hypothetical protein
VDSVKRGGEKERKKKGNNDRNIYSIPQIGTLIWR